MAPLAAWTRRREVLGAPSKDESTLTLALGRDEDEATKTAAIAAPARLMNPLR